MNKFSKLFKYKYFIFLIFILVFITILAIILILNINSIKNPLLTTALLILWALLSFFIIKYLCLKLFNKIIYLKNTWKMNIQNELEINLIKYITTTHLSECSFVSENCRASELHNWLQIPYRSPFMNAVLDSEVFGRFLQNLEFNVNQPLTFISIENCTTRQKSSQSIGHYIPIVYFGDPSLEIHFIHNTSDQEVLEKWNRRIKRINYDKIITINAPKKYKNKFFRDIHLGDGEIIITKNNKEYTFIMEKLLPSEDWTDWVRYQQMLIKTVSESLEMLLLLV